MKEFQITSVSEPLAKPMILDPLMSVINRFAAMGIALPGRSFALDGAAVAQILGRASKVGLGKKTALLAGLPNAIKRDPARVARLLEELITAIEESPLPASEWRSMRDTFGDEELARLLGISKASVVRYAVDERSTPDHVADRLHWLAMVVADLAGSYNDIGIRRWFHRPRARLNGKTPSKLLDGAWSSESSAAKRIRELARSLTAAGAT